MNKRAILVPLLILVMQANNILGGDDQLDQVTFNQVKSEIEKLIAEEGVYLGLLPLGAKQFSSNPQVEELLNICHAGGGSYYGKCLNIIEDKYPNVALYTEHKSDDEEGLFSHPLSIPIPRKPPSSWLEETKY